VTAPAHRDPTGGVWKAEPVIAAHVAAWFVLNAGLLLVGRLHVLTAVQWSGLSASLTAVVTATLLSLMAWLIRRVVAPAWKVAQTEIGRLGVALSVLPLPDPQPVSSGPLAGTPPPYDSAGFGIQPASQAAPLTAETLLNIQGGTPASSEPATS
jgi:hypothetical protein